LWPDLIRRESFYLVVALTGYFLPIGFGFWKYGRLTSYHTWLSRLSLWADHGRLGRAFPRRSRPAISPGHYRFAAREPGRDDLDGISSRVANVPSLWHAMKSKEQPSPAIPEAARKENFCFVRPHRRKWFKFLLVVGVFGVFGWILLHPERDLRYRATRLNIPTGLLTDESFTYRWLSTNSIFGVREASQGEYEPLKVDLPSGKTTSLTGLDALFQGHEKRSDVVRWSLSPEASWILVQVSLRTNTTYLASSLDGSQIPTRSSPGFPNEFTWMRNGEGWFELVGQRTNWAVRLHRLDSPEFKEISVKLPAGSTRYWIKGVAANGSVLVTGTQPRKFPRIVDLFQIDLNSNPARLARVSVLLPRRANLFDLFVSPDGERLGWHLGFERSRLSEPRFSKQFPYVDFEKVHTSALWVSKIDGSQMREIGRLKRGSLISNAGWMPDSRHFDFGYLNIAGDPSQTFWTFWTVPVE
jgi:hypothetical protein